MPIVHAIRVLTGVYFANTGVTAERLAEIFAVADGVIVGTSLKVDGVTWSQVDPARAARLMETARDIRSRSD